MIFKHAIGTLALCLVFLAPLGCKGIRSADYFPLELGQRWHYFIDDEGDEGEVTIEATERDGERYVLQQTVNHGENELTFPYSTDENTYITVSDTGVTGEYDRPFILLRFPLDEGKSWWAYRSDSATVLGKVAVSVMAGDFENCYKIGYNLVGSDYEYVIWFAPKVGIVKIVEENSYTWELTSTSF